MRLKTSKGGKKSLIRLFAFLNFFCARRKENRKKKIEKRENSPQGNVLNNKSPQLGSCKYTYIYMNRVVGTSVLKIS